MSDYGGVINALVAGTWEEPDTGRRHGIPIGNIVIDASLDGREAELVMQAHPGESLCVVCDERTCDALGQRVYDALERQGAVVTLHVWDQPVCSDHGVEQIRQATRGSDALVAVGSGTINDAVKYASFLDGRSYSAFATSPMNAFTTSTASVSFDGFKQSITCHGANGVFFDLSVLADCPPRLKSACFADVICRTTAQVDWLLSHRLLGTDYSTTPYALLAIDEPGMIANADDLLAGDLDALGMLTRISAIMGLGTSFTVTTHSGSMAEHMISHYIDMFAGDAHPHSSHGEQVGVATMTMSRLQNQFVSRAAPPVLHATRIPRDEIRAMHEADTAGSMIEQSERKALDERQAEALNRRLEQDWASIRAELQQVMLPVDTLRDAMQRAGCQLTASDLELDVDFYRQAVANARFIRDRFSALDVVDDSVGLATFVESMPV